MEAYNKITRNDIDFPRYCYFFIKEIQDSIEEYDIKDAGDEITITLSTSSHPYCSECINLIKKAFIRKKYYIKLSNFKVEKDDDGDKVYVYTWDLKKDDLPF